MERLSVVPPYEFLLGAFQSALVRRSNTCTAGVLLQVQQDIIFVVHGLCYGRTVLRRKRALNAHLLIKRSLQSGFVKWVAEFCCAVELEDADCHR